MEQLTTPTIQLEDLLRKCTPFPWEASMSDTETWTIRSTAAIKYVATELPRDVNNYDRRLWALAPMLAAEVLYLRKRVAELQEK